MSIILGSLQSLVFGRLVTAVQILAVSGFIRDAGSCSRHIWKGGHCSAQASLAAGVGFTLSSLVLANHKRKQTPTPGWHVFLCFVFVYSFGPYFSEI